MNLLKHVPNALTCANLFCGCVAIVFSYTGNLEWACVLIGLAALFDFLDGFAARLLKVSGPLGKQLDSLADMVSFGVAPGALMFMLISHSVTYELRHLMFIAFLIPVFSALRLAKFNIDTRQTDSFIGVPTPANTILIASLPLILKYQPELFGIDMKALILNKYGLIGLTLLMSWLMIAELPLFALKFKDFTWTNNKVRYIFLAAAVVLLITLRFAGIPIIIFLYVALSLIHNSMKKN